MTLVPFQGRVLDPAKQVRAHRNLAPHRPNWSLKQGGLVVAHADEVNLGLVAFHVYEKGRQRAVREGQRNVHAWAVGYVTDRDIQAVVRVSYNPFRGPYFMTDDGLVIDGALSVKLAADGQAYLPC